MDEITAKLNSTTLTSNESKELIEYINTIDINIDVRKCLAHLIENDNHCDYLTIYNICVENDIELPPI
jgi:hypothetical protein